MLLNVTNGRVGLHHYFHQDNHHLVLDEESGCKAFEKDHHRHKAHIKSDKEDCSCKNYHAPDFLVTTFATTHFYQAYYNGLSEEISFFHFCIERKPSSRGPPVI